MTMSRACVQYQCSWPQQSSDAGVQQCGCVRYDARLIQCRLLQRSRATVRMIHYFQRLSKSLSWFDMSSEVSAVVSQVTNVARFFFLDSEISLSGSQLRKSKRFLV
jgi:hypothetical protein